ncbi:MAG TPA: FAD-dependent oxidoreductase [Patescibacteria group bacterium]|nr:FAD-dependent oxidoreductase [Patescibacteria group bacterium]
MYDAVIVGGGPAGLAAALYLARQKLSFVLLADLFGGRALQSADIENYLGFHLLNGIELVRQFRAHLEDYKNQILLKEGEMVREIKKTRNGFSVQTDERSYETKTVLIATGTRPRMLSIPGEKLLIGKGVTYCATCDAPLFRGKKVYVIGGGNGAADAALFASKYAGEVVLVTVNKSMQGERRLLEKVRQEKNIVVKTETRTVRILGRNHVVGIVLAHPDGAEVSEQADGVFVEIGSSPAADFIDLVKKDRSGQIVVDKRNQTSVEGIWAAGDVTDIAEKQIAIAVGEGAKAALSIIQYLLTH